MIDRRDGVFAGDDPEQFLIVGLGHAGGEPTDHVIQFGHGRLGRGALGTGPLGGVVERRQIDVEEIGLPAPRSDHGRVSDPRGRLDVGHRPPVVHQREMPQRIAQLAVKLRWACIAPERFRAVGIVNRGGRADEIGLAALAVHRKPHGRTESPPVMREQVPYLRPLDAVVRGRPHFDLMFFSPIKTVGHNAMLRRPSARGHVGLHRAGDAREAGRKVGDRAAGRQRPQVLHPGNVLFAQGGNGQ